MCRKLSHGLKACRFGCVLALLVLLLAPLCAQESLPTTPETIYALSESDKKQLMQILQSLSDKVMIAQQNLIASEKALQESQAKSQILQAQYDSSMAQLKTLQEAWAQLSLELDALKNDKTLLTQNLTALQAALQDLQDRYQALVTASAQLEADYKALQTAYQEQGATLTQLQASFKAYQKSVQSQKTKSLILEVVLALVGLGWGLDAIGVF